AGCLTSLTSVLLFALAFRFTHSQYVTFLPKSITTAIGMALSEEMGGNTAITVAIIILTGILGNVVAETLSKLFHIDDPVARGLAIGTCSHAIGTSKAYEIGEIEGAMSSLAIALSGIFTVILMNIYVLFY
ncbi:MAG: LrgB family protein, partial [Erysipelotrichaceae bacterium]|nr:LrgB family protein [Erysipelotrichaceae bacterium]